MNWVGVELGTIDCLRTYKMERMELCLMSFTLRVEWTNSIAVRG